MAETAKIKCAAIQNRTIFGDCLDVIEWNFYKDWCEYDMCSRGDDYAMCNIMAAMARDCAMNGHEVDWTAHVCQGQLS